MSVQIALLVPAFLSVLQRPRSGVAESSDSSRLIFLQASHAVFHQGFSSVVTPFPVLPTASLEGLVTIVGLKPETMYAVRLAALNGKGLGEISAASEFKTQPVRK